MKSRKQRYFRLAGIVALASATAYAAGVPPWWMPLDASPLAAGGRAFVLVLLHAFGIAAGALSLDNDMWDREE